MNTLKLISTLLFLWLHTLSFSQITYFDYLDTTSQWHTRIEGGYMDFSCGAVVTYSSDIVTFIMGDTLISGNWYYKLYYNRLDSTYCDTSLTVSSSLIPSLYIREAPNKKIYRHNGTLEVLMWDFNLGIGSIVDNSCTVSTIDSVWLGSRPLKKFNCNCSIGSFILEGVGALTSFLNPSYCSIGFWNQSYLVCYKKQNDVLLINPQFSCDFQVGTGFIKVSKDIRFQDLVRIYPNPIQNNLIVDVDLASFANTVKVNIINSLGQSIISNKVINEKTIFDVSDFERGIYFLEIISGKQRVLKKIIKQ